MKVNRKGLSNVMKIILIVVGASLLLGVSIGAFSIIKAYRDLGKSSTQNNQVNQVANTLPNIDTTGKSKEDVYFELYYTCQKTCFDVSDSEFLKCTARCTTETVDKYTFIYGGAPVQESETDFVAKLNLENSKKYSCIQGCSAETTNCIKGCSGQGIDCMQKCPAQNFSQVISCQKVCLS